MLEWRGNTNGMPYKVNNVRGNRILSEQPGMQQVTVLTSGSQESNGEQVNTGKQNGAS